MIEWAGCYDDSWKGFITDESFCHPAKMARGLTERIFAYLFERGYLKAGDVVVDPFGGIGSTGIVGASLGCRVFCCELEQKFVDLGKANFELHRRTWEQFGDPLPVMVQGDSRKLCEILGPAIRAATACVGSPPWMGDTDADQRGEKLLVDASSKCRHKTRLTDGSAKQYGTSDGQLADMPEGDVSAVCGSPPFIDPRGAVGRNEQPELRSNRQGFGPGITNEYGESEGQLSGLPEGDLAAALISSPPYADRVADERQRLIHKEGIPTGRNEGDGKTYGDAEGNLAAMSEGCVDSVVSSPPLSDCERGGTGVCNHPEGCDCNWCRKNRGNAGAQQGDKWGEVTEGNIGAMPPGDVSAIVGSPPFSERHSYNDPEKEAALIAKLKQDPNCRIGGDVVHQVPGTSPGQLAIMPTGELSDAIVSSPPWEQSGDAARTCNEDGTRARQATSDRGTYEKKYGTTDGQLGTLPAGELADSLVTSPPYEGCLSSRGDMDRRESVDEKAKQLGVRSGWGRNSDGSASNDNYGSDENIGNNSGETFWSAARDIVRQAYLILRPGGVAVWVTKDFIRQSKRVQFSSQWIQLCEACGFELVERIHASLVKEDRHPGLFGEDVVKKKERKSFFRRLAEKRLPEYDERRINHEDVLVMRKPL